MAIAIDSTGQSSRTAAATATYSHTSTGSNLIFVLVTYSEGGNATNDVTSVTYGAQTMTLADTSYANAQYGCNIYYLIAPATGANTVTVTFSTVTANHWCGGASYTGAKQSAQPDNTTTDRTSGGVTVSLTTVADNCWTILGEASGRNPTASTGTTMRLNGVGDGVFLGDSNAAITPAGSTSMAVTEATGGTPGRVMISIAPAVAAGATATYLPQLLTTKVG